MRCSTSAKLANILRVDTGKWNVLERSAFEDFAFVLALVPELKRWTLKQKQALTQIIRTKVSGDESRLSSLAAAPRGPEVGLVGTGFIATRV